MKHWETEIFTFGLFNGELVNVSNVENGLKCNCFCPTCETKLIAIKNISGNKKRPHFRHSRNSTCNFSNYKETVIHYLAKQIIQKKGQINLPITEFKLSEKFINYFKYDTIEEEEDELPNFLIKVEKFQLFKYQEIKIEKKKGEVIPDIQVIINGKNLNVEIAYTHKVGYRKNVYLNSMEEDTIEIDLSNLSAKSTEEEIENILYGSNLKFKWIYNNKLKNKFEEKKNEGLELRYYLWEKAKLLKLYSNKTKVYNCPLKKQHEQLDFVKVESQCKGCNYFLEIVKDSNAEIKKYEEEQKHQEHLKEMEAYGFMESELLTKPFFDEYYLRCSGNLKNELIRKINGS